ncbi:MAG: ATP phosphoribosyltransferase [Saprospiraceae bacterium]|nr:ATP phosphoribosyltransferase [Saprospiraceae bacterium]
MLQECGIKINNGKNQLMARSTNFPIDFLFLRDDDIPQYVEDGVSDLGIVGENVWLEKSKKVDVAKKLGFSKCRMCLAVPKSIEYSGLDFFNHKNIATSYPIILKKYLDENNINAEIHEISGSVEIAPNIGLAEGIFDIVSTGSTLMSNGLKEVETVLNSEAILITNQDLPTEKQALLDELLFRIESVQRAKNNKYVVLNAPNEKIEIISAILPGMKSPTVVPLQQAGWSALHSVIGEDQFWEIIGKLKAAGAEGILVTPIEKMVL